jgi:hypothetical protein
MRSVAFSKMLLLACFIFLPAMAEAATAAGEILRISGDNIAQAIASDGSQRQLGLGDAVYSGDTISTGKATTLLIKFVDASRFALSEKTEFKVDKFEYKNNDEGGIFHSSFIKGAFRFVSGLIAKLKDKDMKVKLIVATIGVRGTHVEGEISERQFIDGKQVDASAKVVLLEPEENGKSTSIIVSNEFGSVIVDQPGYGTEIPDEKSPPSPARLMQLHTIDNVLRSLRNSVRQGGTPRPRM